MTTFDEAARAARQVLRINRSAEAEVKNYNDATIKELLDRSDAPDTSKLSARERRAAAACLIAAQANHSIKK